MLELLLQKIYVMTDELITSQRLPAWMKMKMPKGKNYPRIKNLVNSYGLHTICTSGRCPNIGDCWNRGTATFMILGDICTRSCKFCGVKTGKPLPPDENEPVKVAESVRLMELKHCVITSVDRDDLDDQGAGIWVRTIMEIKKVNPETKIEVLIPDFRGDLNLIKKVLDAGPDVISHNLETVERLTPQIRSAAKYRRSLEVLKYIADNNKIAKSGIMLGLGETTEEILQTMDDLREAGCRVMTIGQYLAPTSNHIPVVEFIRPEQFDEYHDIGIKKGFSLVESAPLVRSSYRAEEHAHA
jgi:lipoic acid synthetase